MVIDLVKVLLSGGPWDGRVHSVEVEDYESTIFTEDPRAGYYYVQMMRPPVISGCAFGAVWVSTQ